MYNYSFQYFNPNLQLHKLIYDHATEAGGGGPEAGDIVFCFGPPPFPPWIMDYWKMVKGLSFHLVFGAKYAWPSVESAALRIADAKVQ